MFGDFNPGFPRSCGLCLTLYETACLILQPLLCIVWVRCQGYCFLSLKTALWHLETPSWPVMWLPMDLSSGFILVLKTSLGYQRVRNDLEVWWIQLFVSVKWALKLCSLPLQPPKCRGASLSLVLTVVVLNVWTNFYCLCKDGHTFNHNWLNPQMRKLWIHRRALSTGK